MSPVSLRPEDASSRTEELLSMLPEQLIERYSAREADRDEHELQRAEREFSVGVRDLPGGMMLALGQIVRRERIVAATITKCFSHGVSAWLPSIPEVPKIVAIYSSVSDLCADNGYDDLAADLNNAERYAFRSPARVETMTGSTTLKSITRVVAELTERANPIGATSARIFCVGVCRLISLNQRGWADKTIEELLEPEVNHFLWYLRERLLMLEYYQQAALIRIERDSGKQNGKLFSRKLGNGVSYARA